MHTLEEMDEFISINNLPSLLGGDAQFSQEEWLESRMVIITYCNSIIKALNSQNLGFTDTSNKTD